MIEIKDKRNCCGCHACVQKCPKHCIKMIADKEGFLYPRVNKSVCIDCGICESVCPQIHISSTKMPLGCFAIKHPSRDIQLASSSGGAFSILAEYVLKQNGVVFGAAFNKEWGVEHKYIEHIEDLESLRMSKYVQSKIGISYQYVQSFLKDGRWVLFVGTPCQVHGLKLFLKKDYENLLTVDFVCHGVPSKAIWQKYLKSISVQNAFISKIQFRNKQYGWEKFSLVLHTNHVVSVDEKAKSGVETSTKILSETRHKNPYLRGFIHDLYLRPSCYACKNKGFSSNSDLTVADFWGIKNTYPQLYDDAGVSCVTINSLNGSKFLEMAKIQGIDVDFKQVLKFNPSFIYSVKKPPFRNYFFKLINLIPFKPLVIMGQGYNKIARILKLY